MKRLMTRDLLARIALAIVVYAAFALSTPGYAGGANLYSMLEGAVLVGLVAVGLGVTMLAGELDLSVGSIAACAGIVSVQLADGGILAAVLVPVAAASLFGLAQGFAISRLGISSLVFTLGTLIALRGLAYKLSDESTVNLALEDLHIAADIAARIGVVSPASLVMIGAFLAVGAFLGFTRWGREIYAIGGGRGESRAAGVPQTRPLAIAFALSGGLAGLAGALASLKSGSATPLAYDTVLLAAVTAALIGGVSLYGGRGTMLGVFVGVLTLGFLISGLALQSAPFWAESLATGALLLGFLVIELTQERSPVREAIRRLRSARRQRASLGAGSPGGAA